MKSNITNFTNLFITLINLWGIKVSVNALQNEGTKVLLMSRFKAAYAKNSPSGILTPILIAKIVNERHKFPPAESPASIILSIFIPKHYLYFTKIFFTIIY
jgi:hypothetical protein